MHIFSNVSCHKGLHKKCFYICMLKAFLFLMKSCWIFLSFISDQLWFAYLEEAKVEEDIKITFCYPF